MYSTIAELLHERFVSRPGRASPFIVGIAGGVAAGKSTTADALRALVEQWPERPSVELVSTDGFLLPNAVLAERGLLDRKGFPETYDRRALLQFVEALASGAPEVTAPVYSHVAYDIVLDEVRVLRRPDVVLLEGLNVLQRGEGPYVSAHFDATVYVDAPEHLAVDWYLARLRALRPTMFSSPEGEALARQVWDATNGPNLRRNILPTRELADIVIEKGAGHRIVAVHQRPNVTR